MPKPNNYLWRLPVLALITFVGLASASNAFQSIEELEEKIQVNVSVLAAGEQIRQHLERDEYEKALNILLTNTVYDTNPAVSQIIGVWGQKDLEAATNWVVNYHDIQIGIWSKGRAIEEADQRQMAQMARASHFQLIPTIAWLRVNRDLQDAITWLNTLEDELRPFAEGAIAGYWAKQDPEKAAEWVANLPESPSPRRVVLIIAQEWAKVDLESAANWGIELLEAKRNIPEVLQFVAQHDPQKAMALVETLEPAERLKARQQAIMGWANKDAQQAIKWISSIQDERTKNALQDVATTAWATHQPIEAAKWLEENDIKRISNAIRPLSEVDPAMATLLVARHGEPGYYRISAVAWGKKDPAKAVAWAEQLEGDRSFAHIMVAAGWAEVDPAAAANWLYHSEREGDRMKGMQNVLVAWAEKNPKEAIAWADTLTDSKEKISALESAVFGWAKKDLKAAADWLNTIQDRELRIRLTAFVGIQWQYSDLTGFKAWLETFTEEDRAAIIEWMDS